MFDEFVELHSVENAAPFLVRPLGPTAFEIFVFVLIVAFGFVVLAGWIGQMINAHIYHIGVRVLLTIYRGEDDESRPQSVLDGRLSWGSFAAFQFAIASAAAGLLAHSTALVGVGATLGFIGWLAAIGNLAGARTRAMRPATISLL